MGGVSHTQRHVNPMEAALHRTMFLKHAYALLGEAFCEHTTQQNALVKGHLLADHPVSLHIIDRHWWKLCRSVICFPHPWHLLLLKLGFSTKLHLHCLHLARLCGLCHHPPLSNSGNVSDHHLTGSNKTGCWSSFVSFVASFSSVQFCHPWHLSSYSYWLGPLIWTWNSTMLSSPSPASCELIDHCAFFTDSTKRPPM